VLPELFNSASWSKLAEVNFVNYLVSRPFGEFVFLAHVFLGIRSWGLGFRRDKGTRGWGDGRLEFGNGKKGERSKGRKDEE
jgi:hypothetical protein